MAIRSVTKQEFNKFKPARSPMSLTMIQEVEWFADDAGNVIGVLAQDKFDKDWSVAVLGRDERGSFRFIDGTTCIQNQSDARTELKKRMEKAVTTGDTVFPQGD